MNCRQSGHVVLVNISWPCDGAMRTAHMYRYGPVMGPYVIKELRVKNANFTHINPDTDRPWIYYIGGGSGSGLVLLIVMCCLLYWCCKRTQSQETRLPAYVTNAAPENPNIMHTRMGAIGTDKYLIPGQETVGIQDPVGMQCKVLSNDMQYAFATACLDQLEDYGANVKEHHR